MNKKLISFKLLFLFIVPAILILIFIQFHSDHGPYFLAENSDPEYAYLFNSLQITDFKSPYHIDHPGTTLQLLGAFTIKLSNINRDITTSEVLINSERYLLRINILLFVILVFTIIAIGISTYIITNNIWFGIIIQASILFSPTIYLELVRVRPEYLLILASLLLSYLLVTLLKNDISKKTLQYTILFSLICGFGIATKIIFLPIIVIPLIILPKIKNKLYFIAGTILTFAIFTIPIWTQYGRIYTWIKKLLLHSGKYGSGTDNIINPEMYINGIETSLLTNPIFSITILTSIIFIIICLMLKRHHKIISTIEFKILITLIFTQIAQILFVSKHFAAHYLLPSLLLTGVTIIYLIINIKKVFKVNFNTKVLLIITACLTLFLYYNISNTISSIVSSKKESMKVVETLQDTYKDYATIHYYRSSSHTYALKFGNNYSHNLYSSVLNIIYPKSYFYNIWNNNYYNYSGKPLDLNDIITENSRIIYTGTSFENYYKDHPNYKPTQNLRDIYNGKNETIYILEK